MQTHIANMHNWDDYRFFLAVARQGSVSAAALKLEVNQSTVSRRISEFEKQLGVRLFERLASGFQLTDIGSSLLTRATNIEDEVLTIQRDIVGKDFEPEGSIRVTTSLIIADYLLIPQLPRFNSIYPKIEIHLDISDSNYNLVQREADIALRVASSPPPENLIGKELCEIELGVYGSRTYLDEYKKTKNQVPLNWIGEANNKSRPDWLPRDILLRRTMRTNNVLSTIAAIKAGIGIGRIPGFAAKSSRQLLKFQGAVPLPKRKLWMLSHADTRQVERIRVFNSFLKTIGAKLF